LGVVVDFNLAVFLVFVPCRFDDFKSPVVSFGIAVGTESFIRQRIEGLVAFGTAH
jgi:hypothetical protein